MGIDLKSASDWQFIDESNGLVYPWYTRPTIDYLNTLDLSDKVVFEYGLGASSVWWANKCKALYGVDDNPDYVEAVKQATDGKNAQVWHADGVNYVELAKNLAIDFDIVIIDGIYREECAYWCLRMLQPGYLLIYDNWMQDSVALQSQETQDILLAYPHKIFKQDGHDDWATLAVQVRYLFSEKDKEWQ